MNVFWLIHDIKWNELICDSTIYYQRYRIQFECIQFRRKINKLFDFEHTTMSNFQSKHKQKLRFSTKFKNISQNFVYIIISNVDERRNRKYVRIRKCFHSKSKINACSQIWNIKRASLIFGIFCKFIFKKTFKIISKNEHVSNNDAINEIESSIKKLFLKTSTYETHFSFENNINVNVDDWKRRFACYSIIAI